MGALLSLFFSVDKKPHHVEGELRCACDDGSRQSSEDSTPHTTSTKSAAVALETPT